MDAHIFDAAAELRRRVIEPLRERYPGKDEVIELIALVVCAGDNLLIVGPPGTAKSELVAEIAERIGGRHFEYLLTRFTEPSEVFGPVDIARLREGVYATSTEGMLPEAEIVFLDEIFHASSAILNSLLGILSSGVFRRGAERRSTEILSVLAASNRLPDDPALAALLDRFTLRVETAALPPERIADLMRAGWQLETERLACAPRCPPEPFTTARVRQLRAAAGRVDLDAISGPLARLVQAVRASGVFLSDRRAIRLQRLAATSAVLCGRDRADPTDLWPARYVWESEEDAEPLREVVADAELGAESHLPPEEQHPLAAEGQRPAELLEAIETLEHDVGGLTSSSDGTASDDLQNRLLELDSLLRWCRPRSSEEEDTLRELSSRLDSLSATLARREARP